MRRRDKTRRAQCGVSWKQTTKAKTKKKIAHSSVGRTIALGCCTRVSRCHHSNRHRVAQFHHHQDNTTHSGLTTTATSATTNRFPKGKRKKKKENDFVCCCCLAGDVRTCVTGNSIRHSHRTMLCQFLLLLYAIHTHTLTHNSKLQRYLVKE